jgi:hypothetical protein
MRSTQNFHMDTRGWADIAYNFAINRFGEVWEGRGWDVINAASGDTWANTNLIAVELQLGEGDVFTPQAKNTLVEFVRFYQRDMKRARNLYVHKDVALTACPGPEIDHFVHIDLQALVDIIDTPQPEDDEVPSIMLVLTSGAVLGRFSTGNTRELLVQEYEAYKAMGVREVHSVSAGEDAKATQYLNHG